PGAAPRGFPAGRGSPAPGLSAAPCRYAAAGDTTLLGRSHTIIPHRPARAATRGVTPPIAKLRAAGAPIANGTDNNTNDLFEVMRVALLTERISRDDPFPGVHPQPEDVLADATLGGARALRKESQIGSIAVGRKADLLVVDTRRPHLVPAGRFVSAWIHNGQPGDIESVMIDGRFVMRDRKVLTMDEDAIVREADAVGRRIWKQVGPVPIPG